MLTTNGTHCTVINKEKLWKQQIRCCVFTHEIEYRQAILKCEQKNLLCSLNYFKLHLIIFKCFNVIFYGINIP